MKIEIEHILLLVIGAFILYHFMSRGCGCNRGFRVGAKVGQSQFGVGTEESKRARLGASGARLGGNPNTSFDKTIQNLKSTAECNDRVAEVEAKSDEVMRQLFSLMATMDPPLSKEQRLIISSYLVDKSMHRQPGPWRKKYL